MGNFNKVLLMGNLTRDVELRSVNSGQQVAAFGLAINRYWYTPDGEKREETTFVDCEAWGKTAETLSRFLSKGRPVFVEGRLKLDQWEKEGQKFSKLRVVVETFQFVDSKGGGAGTSGGGYDASTGESRPSRSSAPSGRSSNTHQSVPEEDIPF